MKKFASQIMYTCSVVKNPDENPVSLMTELTTEHVYIIRRSEFLHFRGSCASIFVIFSLKWLKISCRIQILILEPP